MPDFDPSNLHDPSTYDAAKGPQRRLYNYKVQVNFSRPINGKTTQYVTVASNDVLTEEQIVETANMFAVSGEYGVNQEDISEINITNATRSSGIGL